MSKKLKIIIISVLLIASSIFLLPKVIKFFVQGADQEQAETDIKFSEITTDFVHTSNFKDALPFMALAAIDTDNDGVDEIFVGGGIGQQDAILSYNNGGLSRHSISDSIKKRNDDPTYGAASIDANNSGLVDLFVVRSSGVYLYENQGSSFLETKIDFALDRKSLPLSISLGDINKDGFVDLYVSNYIRPEFVEGETVFNRAYGGISNLLLNNGDNTFTDITKSSGVYEQHNTFTAVFVDLNNNGYSDLVIAQDTGLVKIFKNNGDLSFSNIELPVTYSYPMGIAVSDFDNNGYLDLYFSNVGTTLPDFMVRGDLTQDQELNKDYILLKNNGDFDFQDVASDQNADKYGFGWGLVSYDFNNDTLADYLVTQNYIRFPGVDYLELYSGSLLQQFPDGKFRPVESNAGIENKSFGVTTVVSDFNNDGWPDVVIGNLNSNLRAFINDGGSNHWLKIKIPDNVKSLGCIITIETASGKTFTKQVYSSEGLGSDQTTDIFFGLGDDTEISNLTLSYQNGKVISIPSPATNTTLSISEYLEKK